jgi:nickel/cobalt transporter (NicO) family protein
MTNELMVLTMTAGTIGVIHTLLGPDHYIPFTMMAWARRWSAAKTTVITLLCGLGHIGSSVVLGLLGVAFGWAVGSLEVFEGFRGNIAGWALIAFGLVYFVWGFRRAIRNKPHSHSHHHEDEDPHEHTHTHFHDHAHLHTRPAESITPWVLFVVFVLGPCVPLIPLLMYPAAEQSVYGLWLVTAIFGAATLTTMLTIVLLTRAGINFLPHETLQRFTHALAGGSILLCGLAIQFLGL